MDRHPPTDPLHFLLDDLYDLKKEITFPPAVVDIIEAHDYFSRHSGRDCAYAKKCRKIFMEKYFDKLNIMITRMSSYCKQLSKD